MKERRYLVGRYELPISNDGRIRLPRPIADAIGKDLAAWVTSERAIGLCDQELLTKSPVRGPEFVRVDLRCRCVLPARLRRETDLQPGGACVLVGLGTYVEVWGPERYDAYLDRTGS